MIIFSSLPPSFCRSWEAFFFFFRVNADMRLVPPSHWAGDDYQVEQWQR
jgi:hypothetical protein